MKLLPKVRTSLTWGLFALALCACQPEEQQRQEQTERLENHAKPVKYITLDAGKTFQTVDGFGVNVTPAQWQGGHLKGAIDTLVSDLGSTLIRFDCYGRANWLNPNRQAADGTFPEEYLAEVYTSPTFRDAWASFRYFNQKGIQPIFNVSGFVPMEWAEPEGPVSRRLTNFDAYAEMITSMLQWAREKEKLQFSLFMPFNETNYGHVEGPLIPTEDCIEATRAVLRKMQAKGLGDVKLILMDDTSPVVERVEVFLKEPALRPHIYGFGTHTYGNGLYEDGRGSWYQNPSPFREIIRKIARSPYQGSPLWLTEYGDLDQTGEIEFTFAWLSTRRLLSFLNDGGAGAIAWDAYDNFHEHDTAWARYGLLYTDTTAAHWTYSPKPRYYAAKQVYRYVKPGFKRIHTSVVNPDSAHIYAGWRDAGRHLLLSAYASPDGKAFTLVGMNNAEGTVELEIDLQSFAPDLDGTQVQYLRTSRTENCRLIGTTAVEGNRVRASVPERAIFTLTTLK